MELIKIYSDKVLNLELEMREYRDGVTLLQSKPSKAIVELTENCNFRCVMCSQSFDPKYSQFEPSLNMPLELFTKVAKALFPKAVMIDLRGFGETLILPYWNEILDALESYPLVDWHLVTNLSLKRDATYVKMMNLGFILGISFDAARAEVFEKIRQRSQFSTILHNLEVLKEARKTSGKGFLYFIVTVQRQNIQELPAIVETAHRFGITEVQFKMVRQFDSYLQHQEMIQPAQLEELKASLNEALDKAIELGVRLTLNDLGLMKGIEMLKIQIAGAVQQAKAQLNFAPPADIASDFLSAHPHSQLDAHVQDLYAVSKHQKCFKPYSFTYITSDGRVGTCNHMMSPEILEMGSLKYQDFDEIWNGDDYVRFRKSLNEAKPRDFRCQWCFQHRQTD